MEEGYASGCDNFFFLFGEFIGLSFCKLVKQKKSTVSGKASQIVGSPQPGWLSWLERSSHNAKARLVSQRKVTSSILVLGSLFFESHTSPTPPDDGGGVFGGFDPRRRQWRFFWFIFGPRSMGVHQRLSSALWSRHAQPVRHEKRATTPS